MSWNQIGICHLASWKMFLFIQCYCVKLGCVSAACTCHDSLDRQHKKVQRETTAEGNSKGKMKPLCYVRYTST